MLVAPNVSYPGVYIQEVESEVRTIIGVDTATTAFVGRALRGPIDEPVVVTSYADFERIFGGLWLDNALGYAVKDFYDNGGTTAVIVRLFNAGSPQELADTLKAAAQEFDGVAGETANTIADKAIAVAAEEDATISSVLDAVAEEAAKPEHGTQTRAPARDAITLLAHKTAVPLAQMPLDSARLSAEIVLGAAKREQAKEGADLAAVQAAAQKAVDDLAAPNGEDPGPVQNAAAAMLALITQDFVDNPDSVGEEQVQTIAGEANGDSELVVLEAKHPGSWGNRLRIRVSDVDPKISKELADNFGVPEKALFDLSVYDETTEITEVFSNVTLVAGPKQLHKVLKNQSNLIRVADDKLPETLPDRPLAHPTGGDEWEDQVVPTNTKVNDDDKVADGKRLTSGNFILGRGNKQGIYALEDADLFNLLYIPPYSTDISFDVDGSTLAAAESYCVERRAVLIVDAPVGWKNVDDAQNRLENDAIDQLPPSTNAALYFPRLRKSNPLRDNRIEDSPPGGSIAGILARTDATRGVWKAPAGLEAGIRGVQSLSAQLTDLENGRLNPLGINCLRTLPAAGSVVWGARTMAGDDNLASQWKYLPVRRTALYIEESLYRGIQWAVFEPNDEPLWSQLRLNIGVFMNGLFRQGAFQGQSPKDAYFVKCDSSTTTQADIDRGIVNVVVGFAPLKPAEFVVLYIKQLAGSLET